MHITVNTWLPNCMHMYVMIVINCAEPGEVDYKVKEVICRMHYIVVCYTLRKPVRTLSAVNMYPRSRCSFTVCLTVLVPFGKLQPVIFHFSGSISSLDVTHPCSSHNTLTKLTDAKRLQKLQLAKAFQMELEQ